MRSVRAVISRARLWRVGAALLIAAAVAAGCSGSNGGSPVGVFLTGIFFPLNSGDTRSFRQTNAAGATVTLTRTVDAPTTISGFTVLPMITRNADGTVARVGYDLADSANGVAWAGSDEGTSTLWLTPPLVTPLNLIPGQAVTETVSATGTGAFANVKTLTSTFQFVRLE